MVCCGLVRCDFDVVCCRQGVSIFDPATRKGGGAGAAARKWESEQAALRAREALARAARRRAVEAGPGGGALVARGTLAAPADGGGGGGRGGGGGGGGVARRRRETAAVGDARAYQFGTPHDWGAFARAWASWARRAPDALLRGVAVAAVVCLALLLASLRSGPVAR